MLHSLEVKNLALIQEAEVEFSEGLNILSGETGAGKSIIIGSVNLALGAKADADMIRRDAESAGIQMVFSSTDPAVITFLKENDLPEEEDGTIVITRKIQPGRSVFKINGETVTARQVKALAEYLIDIHGQHEHQSLLKTEKHREILDDYAGEKLGSVLTEIAASYNRRKEILKDLQEADVDEVSRVREMDLLKYELEEIQNADCKAGEDEELEQDYRRMSRSDKIREALEASLSLSSYSNDMSVSGQLDRALRELGSVSDYDPKLDELLKQLTEIDDLVSDYGRSVSDYADSLELDEGEFARIEDRLNTINRLKAKYGGSIEGILKAGKEREERLDKLSDLEAFMEERRKDREKEEKILKTACKKAEEIRKAAAAELSERLKNALIDLNFLHVEFEVEVRPDPEKITSLGWDSVEFMISANPGEPMRPLSEIASGGELSRVMLALKTVVARKDSIETLIFDEIDTGISGKTAWKVSEKLGELSGERQVICITHLPQIAAMADTHFYIEKSTDGSSTATSITKLSKEEKVRELARMLGAGDAGEAAEENARELLKTAEKVRRS